MARGMIGRKLGMTQIFDQDGNLVPVTVIELGPNHVVQVKTKSGKDGYNAVKLAFGAIRAKNVSKPEMGVFKHAKLEAERHVIEFRLSDAEIAQVKQGDVLDGSFFVEGSKINVVGTSKGKGFAGVIKRHHMKGAKEMSHGTHEYDRHGGAIGAGTYPGHVFKNKRMAGHMGCERVTSRNLRVVGVNTDEHLLLVSGTVPGAPRGIVQIMELPAKAPKKGSK
jgi:large subunit ribosomal protein L3